MINDGLINMKLNLMHAKSWDENGGREAALIKEQGADQTLFSYAELKRVHLFTTHTLLVVTKYTVQYNKL